MTIQKLEELLGREESEKLDFKLEFRLDQESRKKEFVKDVCAIANSKGGRGYLIFGVKDKTKEIVGVTTKIYDEERVQQIISSRIDPPVPVRLEEIEYQNKKLVVLTIFKSDQQPHQVLRTGTFYIRRGSTSDIARRQEIATLLQENGFVSWEKVLLRNSTHEDLDWNLMRKYISRDLDIRKEASFLLLEALGIIGKERGNSSLFATAGGILLFGKNTQLNFPASGVHIEWENQTLLIEGNIPTLLQKTHQQLQKIFKNTNYPMEAVYESLYNSIVHRDYWDISREINIDIQSKKIEITNPGAIWKAQGAIRFEDELIPPRRNPWLYQRLLFLGQRENRLNPFTGIRNIKNCFPNTDNAVKFINLPKKNLFKVVLPGLDEWN